MHKRISINGLCFGNPPLAEMTGHLHTLGAKRVSLVSMLLEGDGIAATQAALKSGPYEVETICHPFLLFGEHVDPRPETWESARARFNRMVDTATGLGAQSMFTVSGGHGSLTWEDAAEAFSRALAPCVAYAKAAGLPLMIENTPAVWAHTGISHSLRDTVTLAEMADVGVCMDMFSCWTEAGLKESIRRVVPRCHIVQVADYVYGDRALPARAVPCDGAIPVKRLVDWLLEAGYTGMFDIELAGPRIDQEGHLAATRRAADTLGEILNSLGA